MLNLTSSNITWNEERGYYEIVGPLVNNGLDEVILWPSDLHRAGEWVEERELPFLLYYRPHNRDHIVQDGDTLCHHNVRIPEPASDDLKPISQVTEREWRLLTSTTSDVCSECKSYLYELELLPEDIPEGMPEFNCPECGEPASQVGHYLGTGMVHHSDGTKHQIDFPIYDEWRRGEDNDE